MLRDRYYQVEWSKRFETTRAMVDKMLNPRRPMSLNTVKQYCHSVMLFCKYMKEDNPDKLLSRVKENPKAFADGYVDYLLQKRKQTPKTVRSMFYGLKYWLESNNVDTKSLKDVVLPKSIAVTEDRTPTRSELRKILDFASIREKALTEIGISSGLRVNTIASLQLKDVVWNPYALIDDKATETLDTPAMVRVQPAMGRKTSRKFFTFITPEAKKILKEYLEWRKRKGENLTSESPLIGSVFGLGKEKHFVNKAKKKGIGKKVSADMLMTAWKRLLRKAGLDAKSHKWHELHFHTLRKYFKTQCVNAGVKSSYIEFWLGHKGGYLDDSYFRANLREHLNEYRKAIPNLSILEVERVDKEAIKREVATLLAERELQSIAEKHGVSVDFIKNILGITVTAEYLERMSEYREKIEAYFRKQKKEDCQKIVSESELEKYLRKGFRVCAVLPSGKIVISNE